MDEQQTQQSETKVEETKTPDSSNTQTQTPSSEQTQSKTETPVAVGGETKTEEKKDETAQAVAPFTLDSLKLPEGVTLDVESPVTKGFLVLANEMKLTPAQAQRLVDLQLQSVTEASERGSSSFAELVEGWRESLNKDPEVGGDKLTDTLREANRIVDQYGTPELKTALQTTGMGNHPEFARLLRRLAPMITEPKPVGGGNRGSQGNAPSVDNLYPNPT